MIAGIDFSSRAVDVVLLDEDTDAATWHRFELRGADAFERARSVREAMPYNILDRKSGVSWDDVLAVGIEQPQARGPRAANIGALYRIQGAVLACLPAEKLVEPMWPSVWRKTVGLPGNAPKAEVRDWIGQFGVDPDWPQDACDAFCLALATRTLIQKVAA